MTTDTAIHATGLIKEFKGVRALKGVDLTVPQGQILAILGPNGAGKTTLIDLILGLTRPTDGSIQTNGEIGAVLQTGGLLPELTVEQTIKMIAATYPGHRDLDELMEATDTYSIRKRRVTKCSGGEQQRVRLALATIADPDIIILDEPTAGMDPAKRHEFWATIQQQADLGKTIIFTTHYMEEAQRFAERIVFMNMGQIIADGSNAEIQAQATHAQLEAIVPEHLDAELSAHPLVSSFNRMGSSVRLNTAQADDLARFLLTETPAHGLRITSHSLEDVFLNLTEA